MRVLQAPAYKLTQSNNINFYQTPLSNSIQANSIFGQSQQKTFSYSEYDTRIQLASGLELEPAQLAIPTSTILRMAMREAYFDFQLEMAKATDGIKGALGGAVGTVFNGIGSAAKAGASGISSVAKAGVSTVSDGISIVYKKLSGGDGGPEGYDADEGEETIMLEYKVAIANEKKTEETNLASIIKEEAEYKGKGNIEIENKKIIIAEAALELEKFSLDVVARESEYRQADLQDSIAIEAVEDYESELPENVADRLTGQNIELKQLQDLASSKKIIMEKSKAVWRKSKNTLRECKKEESDLTVEFDQYKAQYKAQLEKYTNAKEVIKQKQTLFSKLPKEITSKTLPESIQKREQDDELYIGRIDKKQNELVAKNQTLAEYNLKFAGLIESEKSLLDQLAQAKEEKARKDAEIINAKEAQEGVKRSSANLLAECDKNIKGFEGEILETKRDLITIEENIASLNEKITSLNTKLDQKDREINMLSEKQKATGGKGLDELKDPYNEFAKLQGEIRDLTNETTAKEQARGALQEKLIDREDKLKDVIAQYQKLGEGDKNADEAFGRKMISSRKQQEENVKKVESLQLQLKPFESDIKDISSKIEAVETDIANLEQAIAIEQACLDLNNVVYKHLKSAKEGYEKLSVEKANRVLINEEEAKSDEKKAADEKKVADSITQEEVVTVEAQQGDSVKISGQTDEGFVQAPIGGEGN